MPINEPINDHSEPFNELYEHITELNMVAVTP